MDIAGSTSIAQHMDPEDVSEVFDTNLKQLAQSVALHGLFNTRFQIQEVDRYKTEGYYWRQARFLLELGDSYAQRNNPGDSGRACETYQQSLVIITEMGATGFMRVLEERLGRHE
jgi:hypothetical protein